MHDPRFIGTVKTANRRCSCMYTYEHVLALDCWSRCNLWSQDHPMYKWFHSVRQKLSHLVLRVLGANTNKRIGSHTANYFLTKWIQYLKRSKVTHSLENSGHCLNTWHFLLNSLPRRGLLLRNTSECNRNWFKGAPTWCAVLSSTGHEYVGVRIIF